MYYDNNREPIYDITFPENTSNWESIIPETIGEDIWEEMLKFQKPKKFFKLFHFKNKEKRISKMNIKDILGDKDFQKLSDGDKAQVINYVLQQNPDFLQLPPEEKGEVRKFLIQKILRRH